LKVIGLLLVIICLAGISDAESSAGSSGNPECVDCTDGGYYDTDFNSDFMAEWWYQNGDMRLVGENGEKRNLAFFAVMAHQESPTLFNISGVKYSQPATFYALYPYGEPVTHNYTRMYVPRSEIGNYIEFHVPYLNFTYPGDYGRFYGSSSKGYGLNYSYDNVQLDLFFTPRVQETVDRAIEPVNFTTYERAYGKLQGTVILDGKKYRVTQADGYFDHMIPYATDQHVWGMEMHGWSWSELTTGNFQTIFYGVRAIEDGYNNYTYKSLTLINKNTGKMVAKYSGDEIGVEEGDWVNVVVKEREMKRPATIKISTSDLNISINAQSVAQLDKASLPDEQPLGFVDFMAFQPEEATIEYKGNTEKGSAFYEYMISDWGILNSPK
jgi:hypothetical protein